MNVGNIFDSSTNVTNVGTWKHWADSARPQDWGMKSHLEALAVILPEKALGWFQKRETLDPGSLLRTIEVMTDMPIPGAELDFYRISINHQWEPASHIPCRLHPRQKVNIRKKS